MSAKVIMSVFGTRPEAVKMCPLVREIMRRNGLRSVVCVSAQHREMLDSVTDFFGIKPEYDLNIMKSGQTLSSITSDILYGMDGVFEKIKPDAVLVHGDTTTSFASALSAFYHQIPVAHIEAGLRTYDRYSPFPEEMNRCMTGRLAQYHFAPTERNRKNLAAEGIIENVYVTGNTVLDTFAYTLSDSYVFHDNKLRTVDFSRHVIAMTAHRRENQSGGIASICRAVLRLCKTHPDVTFVYPVHLSPAVRNTVFPLLDGNPQVILCDPVDLTDMHNLMAKSYMVMTDSGGLQEEAPHLGKPVLVLRSETERPEAVDAGTVKVIGVDEDVIVSEAGLLLDNPDTYAKMARAVNPYGDGHASERICNILEKL